MPVSFAAICGFAAALPEEGVASPNVSQETEKSIREYPDRQASERLPYYECIITFIVVSWPWHTKYARNRQLKL
jgi:hypothetical protein